VNEQGKQDSPKRVPKPVSPEEWELEEPELVNEYDYTLEDVLAYFDAMFGNDYNSVETQASGSLQSPSSKAVVAWVENTFRRRHQHDDYRRSIGIRGFKKDIADAVYYITRESRKSKRFPWKRSRIVAFVHTCMLALGLRELERMVTGSRQSIIDIRKKAIENGSADFKGIWNPPQYEFIEFLAEMDRQQTVYCLFFWEVFDGLERLASDYQWTLSFTAQIAMTLAIAKSEKLPTKLVERAKRERASFEKYLKALHQWVTT